MVYLDPLRSPPERRLGAGPRRCLLYPVLSRSVSNIGVRRRLRLSLRYATLGVKEREGRLFSKNAENLVRPILLEAACRLSFSLSVRK